MKQREDKAENELKREMRKYLLRYRKYPYMTVGDKEMLEVARHFANWQKERMMKGAAGKTCCGCAKQKWEYCEKVYSNRGPMNEFEKTQRAYSFLIFTDKNLNEMGMEGWEAIHINEGKWTTEVMFKRLKIEENGKD